MVAPFRRELGPKLGQTGKDVTAVQRALIHAGRRRIKPTGTYDAATRRQINAYKKKFSLRPDGLYGKALHGRLVKAGHFDAYGIWLLGHAEPPSVDEKKRAAIVAAAVYAHNLRARINYTQGSQRMQDFDPPPNVPNNTDCSAFATWCYKSAGAADPNGRGYDGYGYTGTQIQHGRRITTSEVEPGDLVFYGRNRDGDPTHVAVAIGAGRVVSHGSDAGPLLLGISYRHDLHSVRSYL